MYGISLFFWNLKYIQGPFTKCTSCSLFLYAFHHYVWPRCNINLHVSFKFLSSLNWQHQLCKNPRPNPDIKTLFTDHSCAVPANGARGPPPTNGPLVGPIPKSGAFPPLAAHSVSKELVTFLSIFDLLLPLFNWCCPTFLFSLFNQLSRPLQLPLQVGWQILTHPYHTQLWHKSLLVWFSLKIQVLLKCLY